MTSIATLTTALSLSADIIKKIFYDIHETSTDMYTFNGAIMAVFIVSIITQLKCFTLRRNLYELQKFYANCLGGIIMEKPTLSGYIKNG